MGPGAARQIIEWSGAVPSKDQGTTRQAQKRRRVSTNIYVERRRGIMLELL